MLIYRATFNRRQQRSLMATPRKAILALLSFILPLLTSLINLKFQNQSNSVFQTHPMTTLVAISGLLVFALSFGIESTFHSFHLSPTCAAVLRTTMVFSGFLSLASFASLLFPAAWRPGIYVIYLPLSLGNCLYGLVRKWGEWVQQGMMDKLKTLFTRMQQWPVSRSPPILPLTNMDTS
ncbi:hypothetical protein PVL29_019451 [Vitis rotundifolia]|uniref:Uncharacterized protein n=1 Tax=Vitis rotundifolia TaxID=103349 RepID=A0AA38Z0K1_VITRO|nr:hypothetical protein PVL29_019451 [Vitis rotundifolia]